MRYLGTAILTVAVVLALGGCAGQQVRDLRRQNEVLVRENAELADRLRRATGEQIRLTRELDALLDQHTTREASEELEREHRQLLRENEQLRDLLEQTVGAAAIEQEHLMPDHGVVPPDTGGAFVAVDDLSMADLAQPDARSPLASSGIVVDERNGVRHYYDALVNRATPQALYLMIEHPRGRPAELFMVINERYPRSKPPLAFRRVVVNGDSGSIALPISAGAVSRLQDGEYRFESVRFSYTSAVEAAVRVAVESRHPVLELVGASSLSQRPIRDTELTALTNILYAYDTLRAARH
ncbi:MAG: hypothetical protein EA384_10690 [Spirochaetaceae bacterium]|nr:MAG: hypothetical protein EA384_10690 [Spirochaetaceae bacterium]